MSIHSALSRSSVALAAATILVLSVVGAASAASPTATTGSATSIGTDNATLRGTVDPNGQSTSYYFEFGTSSSYGTKTASKNAGAGNNPTSVTINLNGLTPATTYHFRLVASNSSGTSLGADQSFTTAGPPVVQTGTAQNVSVTTATLTGSVDPRGRNTNAYFEYGTTTSYGTRTATQDMGSNGTRGISAALTGLTQATVYHYRVVATSNAGTSRGSDLTFTTLAAVTITEHDLKTVAGHLARVAGTITGAGAGVQVTILAQEFGVTGFTPIATVPTGATGNWSYLARPKITTSYEAQSSGGTSAAVTIGVAPAVSFQLITGARFSTRVTAKDLFPGKLVQFQRLTNGRWVTLKQTRLNSNSLAIFPATLLPRGTTSTIRIAMSVNQAGPGYLGGFSRTLVYKRA